MASLLHVGQVDFFLASQPLDDDSLEVAELYSEEALLAVPPTHRLAGRERAGIDDLADEVFVVARPGYWHRALVDRLFAEAGRQPVIGCETDEPAAIPALVAADLGAPLLPAMPRRENPSRGVAWLHLDVPDCRRTMRLIWRRGVYLSAAARAFRDTATAWFGQY